MQHDYIQQKEQRCALQEDKQQFIEEIAALRSLAKLAGLTGHLLEDLGSTSHASDDAVHGEQFRQCLDTFHYCMHHWNTFGSRLALLAIRCLLLMAGEMMSIHLNLNIGRATCWFGILCMYVAVAVFTAVLNVQLDDAVVNRGHWD